VDESATGSVNLFLGRLIEDPHERLRGEAGAPSFRRMSRLRLLGVVVAGALVLGCGSAAAGGREAGPLRVLFVGNSLTAANDLPATVAGLAHGRGRFELEYRTVAPGGVSLEDNWRFTGAREELEARPWDVVVLQQGPSALPASRVELVEWAQRWSDAIRARGARPALYAVWPESYRRYAFGAVTQNYRDAAVAAHADLYPAGSAWQAAWRRAWTLKLYGRDGFHPSKLGTTLAALVVYTGITGDRAAAVPLPGIPAATATVLRRAAADAPSIRVRP